jgi:hypothetical protein
MVINLLLFSTLTAQNNQKTLAVGIHFNPNLLTKTPVRFVHENDNIGLYEIEEGSIFGYSVGINLTRYWNDKIGIDAGISLTQRGYNWKYTRVSYTDSVFMRVNHEINPIVDDITNRYYCLDIPVSLKYRFLTSEKVDLHLRVGLVPYFVFKQDITEKYVYIIGGIEEFHHSYTDMKRFDTNVNVSALVALGETFSLTKNLKLQLEVLSNYNIFGMSIGSNDRLLNIGINSGIVYEF